MKDKIYYHIRDQTRNQICWKFRFQVRDKVLYQDHQVWRKFYYLQVDNQGFWKAYNKLNLEINDEIDAR